MYGLRAPERYAPARAATKTAVMTVVIRRPVSMLAVFEKLWGVIIGRKVSGRLLIGSRIVYEGKVKVELTVTRGHGLPLVIV
jgi:hypothetical protein